MPNQRTFLIFALLFVAFLLWQQWQVDHLQAPVTEPVAEQPVDATPEAQPPTDDVPEVFAEDLPAKPAAAQPAPVETTVPGERVTVVTDVMRVVIDTQGGTVVEVALLEYPAKRGGEEPVHLIYQQGSQLSVVQSGLQAVDEAPAPDHNSLYQAAQSEYPLGDAGVLEVPMTWEGGNGLHVTKTFRFTSGSYAIDVTHRVQNDAATPWRGRQYRQLQRNAPSGKRPGFTNPERFSYIGAAWYNPEDGYQKLPYKDIVEEGNLDADTTGGWVAMVQHYFVSAWVPDDTEAGHYYTRALGSDANARYLIGISSPFLDVAPGASAEFHSLLFSGPKRQELLPLIAPGLELTVDYGIFTVISQPLFWLLKWIHKGTGNWGWSIILLTVLIKLVFYKLSETQYRSMARMRRMQPRLQTLKERYGDDKQKLQQATMELYREEKVNPLGGCLPILVQIPVFIALYWVLLESVELRQAPFMLWLQDLSAPDPYFILPVIMGVSMLIQQKLTPTPTADPVQQKVMMVLPVVFTGMFAFFQSGLVLYWTTNQLLSLAQQWVITKRIENEGKGKR